MQFIEPTNLPHDDVRVVFMTEAELQRLRQATAGAITELHDFAREAKATAKWAKKAGADKQDVAACYKEAHQALHKATLLGQAQHALKHQTLNNRELCAMFASYGIRMVDINA